MQVDTDNITVEAIEQGEVVLVHFPHNAIDLMYAAAHRCVSPDPLVYDKVVNIPRDEKIKLIINVAFEQGHINILEMVDMVIESYGYNRVKTHQSMRTRIAVFFQQSQRYVTIGLNPFKWVKPRFIKSHPEYLQSFENDMKVLAFLYNKWFSIGMEVTKNKDRSNELARPFVFGFAPTSYFDKRNLSSWRHNFGLRCCTRAEDLIRDYHNKVLDLLIKEIPEFEPYFGARCKLLGYCPEGKKKCCGLYPTKKDFLRNLDMKG
jgi:thymidylate synthase (FAD)